MALIQRRYCQVAASCTLAVLLCSACGSNPSTLASSNSTPAPPAQAYCLTRDDHPNAVRFNGIDRQNARSVFLDFLSKH